MQRIKKAYAENGDLKIIPETPPLDGSENWEQGRGAYYELDNDPNTGDPLALDIDREQDNYFKNVISKNIKHWQENSYPIYFDDIKYPKNAIVKYTDGNTYVSKVDNNTTIPTDTNNWVNFEDFGSLNINALDEKITPVDTDNLAIQETGGLLKKLSFANLKESLKNIFLTKPELITITGTATFDGLTQKITMTNIGNITLAIGDVIEVSGTTSNNKLFTVESVVDNNNIVVNYEHRGTSMPVPSKRLTIETASNCTVELYNRAKNAPLGQGQGWCVPASPRVVNINYTNLTKREIVVSSCPNINNLQRINVGGFIVSESVSNGSYGNTNTTIIPRDITYVTTENISRYFELR